MVNDAEVYARKLLVSGYGYPLWRPRPNHPNADYCKEGVREGDVGFITSDGLFLFLFNIFLPADHPFQIHGVPKDFSPLVLKPNWKEEDPNMYDAMTSITSSQTKVKKVNIAADLPLTSLPIFSAYAAIELSSSQSEGAALVLPNGGSRTNILHLHQIRSYATSNSHATSWYEFAETAGLEVEKGSLCIVTGFDKASRWGVSSWSTTENSGEISLKFVAYSGAGAQVAYKWDNSVQTSVSSRTGPGDYCDAGTRNQTIFLRGFRIAVRDPIFKLGYKVAISDLSAPKKGSGFCFPRAGISPSRTGQSDATLCPAANVEELGGVGIMKQNYHPSAVVNEYLFKSNNRASIVITHDDVWISVLNENDATFPDDEELMRRINTKYTLIDIDDASYFASKPSASIFGCAEQVQQALEEQVQRDLTEPESQSIHSEIYTTCQEACRRILLPEDIGHGWRFRLNIRLATILSPLLHHPTDHFTPKVRQKLSELVDIVAGYDEYNELYTLPPIFLCCPYPSDAKLRVLSLRIHRSISITIEHKLPTASPVDFVYGKRAWIEATR